MEKIVTPANTADATLGAVELLFRHIIIIEVAHTAEVSTKLHATTDAQRTWRLLMFTSSTQDTSHHVTIHDMFLLWICFTL